MALYTFTLVSYITFIAVTISFNQAGFGELCFAYIMSDLLASVDSCTLNNHSENRAAHIKCSHEGSKKIVTENRPFFSIGHCSAQALINYKSITHSWLPKFL